MRFTAVGNTFTQSFSSTPSTYSAYAPLSHFGLGVNGGGWAGFGTHLSDLNSHADNGTSFKVIFLSREGETWADVAEQKYGEGAWEAKWAAEDGDGTIGWADTHITALGANQAQNASAAWLAEFDRSLPRPQRFYISPLSRAIQTYEITFPLPPTMNSYTPPVVKEDLRETIGVETVNRRRSKTELEITFPRAKGGFEQGFSENDASWKKDQKESSDDHDRRTVRFLDGLWNESGNDTYISVTTHAGTIASFLRVTSHRAFEVAPGELIPLLVRAEPGTAAIGSASGQSQSSTTGAGYKSAAVDGSVFGLLILGMASWMLVKSWSNWRTSLA